MKEEWMENKRAEPGKWNVVPLTRKSKRRLGVFVVVLWFLIAGPVLPGLVMAEYPPLLAPLPQDVTNKLNELEWAAIKRSPVRTQTVTAVTHMSINAAAFQQLLSSFPVGAPAFQFNLPGIAPLYFQVETIRQAKDGRMVWTGVATNGWPGTAHLIVNPLKRTIIGDIRTNKWVYQIRPAGNGAHSIVTVDASLFPKGHTPSKNKTIPSSSNTNDPSEGLIPTRAPATDDQGDLLGADGPVRLISHGSGSMPTVDVTVLYTPQAASAFAQQDGILNEIDDAWEQLVTSFHASSSNGIHANLRLVSERCIEGFESGAVESEVGQLKSAPQVQSWRQSDGADLVILWVKNAGLCGATIDLGIQQIPISASRSGEAFSIVDVACATGERSFAHELGHQLGLFHDRLNAGAGSDPLYNYGFVGPLCTPTNCPLPEWKTIMGWDRKDCVFTSSKGFPYCPRINEWSDGGRNGRGVPIGMTPDWSTGYGPADNITALNLNVMVAANFQPTKLELGAIPVMSACPVNNPPPPAPTNLTVQ